MTETTDTAWYESSFGRDYLRIYAHRDAAEARAAVEALLARVDLPPGARVLDLCCGFGRHLATLLEHDLNAYGLDLSAPLLAHAAENPALRGRILRGDMRALPFRDGVFDAVFSFFSSFGYFTDDRENARVIAEAARLLRPGGTLTMDFLNADLLRRTLVPHDERQLDELNLTQRRWIDTITNSVEKELIVRDASGERHYRESVKLYGLPDFQRFFAAAGLTLTATLGTPTGEPHRPDSPRLVMIARKPAG